MEKLSQSATELLHRASNSVEEGDYTKASTLYKEAASDLQQCLQEVYCAHASSCINIDRFADALAAAKNATRIAPNAPAPWYWKGLALLKDGRREDAKFAFENALQKESDLSKKTLYMDCIAQCQQQQEQPPQEDVPEATGMSSGSARTVPFTGKRSVAMNIDTSAANMEVEKPAVSEPPVDNTRMEWYQSTSHVVIDIFAKNCIKEESVVNIEPTRVSVRLRRADKPDYMLERHLQENVVSDQSTWSASRFKVEIRLKKLRTGVSWTALDKDAQVASASVRAGAAAAKRKESAAAREKEWDSVATRELKDYKEDDSAMAVFRQIYSSSDEDTRRAMMKSYV